jgi:hypothetical protein
MYKYVMSFNDNPIEFPEFLGFTGPYKHCNVLLTDASCKWSNEGCTTNNECCSGSCITRHPGTGPRCEKSSLLRPCLYNYHCENRAICGSKNKCCSDYWNDCRSSKDCCDPVHVYFRYNIHCLLYIPRCSICSWHL